MKISRKTTTVAMIGMATVLGLLTFGVPGASATPAVPFVSILTVPNTAVAGPAPYGTVTVDLTSATTANITFDAGSSGGFTYLFVDSSSAGVNINASSFTPSFTSLISASTVFPAGGFAAASFDNFDSGNVSAFGTFNLTVDLHGSVHNAATEIKFSVTNTSGTWASASDVLALNGDGYDAVAHVVSFNSSNVVNGEQLSTGFVGETAAVPEPGTVLLLGTGLLGLAWYKRQRPGSLA